MFMYCTFFPSLLLTAVEKVDPPKNHTYPTMVPASQLNPRGKSIRTYGMVGKRGVIYIIEGDLQHELLANSGGVANEGYCGSVIK